jgi:hypothetical protein
MPVGLSPFAVRAVVVLWLGPRSLSSKEIHCNDSDNIPTHIIIVVDTIAAAPAPSRENHSVCGRGPDFRPLRHRFEEKCQFITLKQKKNPKKSRNCFI